MSQINDALKRAKEAQKNKPVPTTPPSPLPVKSAPPTPAPEPAKSDASIAAVLLLCGGLVVAFGAGWYFFGNVKASAATEPSKPVVATPAPAPVAVAPAPKVEVTNAPVVAPPPKPVFKLQAIMYDPQRPVALVSGNSVMVGDKVNGYSVRKITTDSVTLANGAETVVLKVQERR